MKAYIEVVAFDVNDVVTVSGGSVPECGTNTGSFCAVPELGI